MDLDLFVAAHRAEWQRLERLVRTARSPRRLSGAEVDELVELYQRVATHLSTVQSTSRDPALLGRLSSLVAEARGAVAGGRRSTFADVARFLRVDFPAVLYRTRWWWFGVTAAFLVVSFAIGAYVAANPDVQGALAPPEVVKQLVEEDFEDYYSSAPAQDFAARVFTNNAFIAAACIVVGVLTLPVVYIVFQNAAGVGVTGGFMAANDRLDLFFGLITPHGLLELTAVFIAAGLGLKLGWTLIDPGERTRSDALAQEGRALVVGALGTALLLFVSGIIEAFVTPSGLPTWGRIAIGVVAEALLLLWVFVLGRRAHRAGATGDLELALRGDTLPT